MHRFSEELFQNAFDLNETIVFEYDVDRDHIAFSKNVNKYLPAPISIDGFVSGMHNRGKVLNLDMEKAITFFTSMPADDKVKMEYLRLLDINGDFFWYQLKGRVQKTSDNGCRLYGTIAYIDDEAKHMADELNKNRDSLTHLLLRDSFLKEVGNYMAEVPIGVMPSVLVIDIDEFDDWKEINGEVGAEGVLIEISRILKRAFRGTDIIGVLGPDRFAVFMKGVRSINILVERSVYVKNTVKDVWRDLSQKSSLTVSIGIAYVNGGKIGSSSLLERGYFAVSEAKKLGRDNYILINESFEIVEDCPDPILSTKEMELVRNILNPMLGFAYAVDEEYRLLYKNEQLNERIGNCESAFCFKALKGYDNPCADCPMLSMTSSDSTYDSEVYSPSLRQNCQIRTTRIVLRDSKKIYIIASTKEDTIKQQEVIERSQNRIRDSLVSMVDVIWDVDIDRNTCIRMKENNLGSIIDMRIMNYIKLCEHYSNNIVYPEDRQAFFETTSPKFLKQTRREGVEVLCREVRLLKISGDYEWYNVYSVFMEDDHHVLVICFNVNDYKKHCLEEMNSKIKYEIMRQKSDILKEMAMSHERNENVNEMIGMLVYEYNVAGDSYYLCPMFEDVFDVSEDLLTDGWSLLFSFVCHDDDLEEFEDFKYRARHSGMRCKTTVRLKNKYGVFIWYSIVIEILRGLNNVPVRYLGTLQNVDSEMKIKREMEYRAHYDSLTGLLNSETFYERVLEALSMNEDKKAAIISVDIDRFRLINDRFGIEIGNKTLSALGNVIKNALPKQFLASRYQSDMFSVMVFYDKEENLLDYMAAMSEPMRNIDFLSVPINLYFGIYIISDRKIPVRLMCDRARAVLRRIKGSAITNYAVYDDEIRLKLREQQDIEQEMYAALDNHEFEMFLQPQVNIRDGKVCGAEALVRWRHPIKGILPPAQFLPLFESNGFITRLDVYMWEEACKYLVKLKEKNIDMPISVNVSRLHIGTTDITKLITELVDKYGIDHKNFEIEITENLFIDDVTDLFSEMEKLKSLGFKILMDDFGSGYSSLNMLRKAPIDVMKIDRFFLDEIMSTERGKIIVESSVRMAKQLGLYVVAEGVETKQQLEFLRSIDCDIAQGYYYSKPVCIDEFEQFIEGMNGLKI